MVQIVPTATRGAQPDYRRPISGSPLLRMAACGRRIRLTVGSIGFGPAAVSALFWQHFFWLHHNPDNVFSLMNRGGLPWGRFLLSRPRACPRKRSCEVVLPVLLSGRARVSRCSVRLSHRKVFRGDWLLGAITASGTLELIKRTTTCRTNHEPVAVRLQRNVPDEDAARAWFEKARWPSGPECYHCGAVGNALYMPKTRFWHCKACRRQFSVTAGTPMHRTHLPLLTWAQAIYLTVSSSKGISAVKLSEMLDVY